jgi:hypothetical protein
MSNLLTHWHIKTTHKEGTPPYPSKDAVYIYLTGCAKELESTEEGKTFELTQFESHLSEVNCKPCSVWASYYFKQKKGLSL